MESSQQMEVPPWWQTHHGIEDKDSRVLWRNDLEKSQLAFELLSCEPVACAQELEVTHLTNPIQFHAWDPRLITRRRSRDVFDAVYDYIMSEIGSRALVIGAPGVGKSRNFLYLLKRFMETNQLVLYHNVASCLVYAFVPLEQVLNHRVDPAHPHELDALAQDPHRYTAFRTGASGMFKCAAMEKVNTIFLHDPSKRPEAVVSADCRMVLIAPPDRNFFRGYTDYDHRTYFLEPCTVEEAVAFYDILKDAIPGSGRRDPDYGLLTSDEIRKAYADVSWYYVVLQHFYFTKAHFIFLYNTSYLLNTFGAGGRQFMGSVNEGETRRHKTQPATRHATTRRPPHRLATQGYQRHRSPTGQESRTGASAHLLQHCRSTIRQLVVQIHGQIRRSRGRHHYAALGRTQVFALVRSLG